MVGRGLKKMYVGLILFFLYAPIFVLAVLSFNQSRSRSRWGGFTFGWYQKLFQNENIMQALYNTILIALVSALIATLLGTMLAFGLNKMRHLPKNLITGLVNIPMLNAEIVTGISLMLLFVVVRYELGITSVLIGHVTFNIPYVLLSVAPRVKQLNRSTYEAALDLGAKPFSAFFRVVMPEIFPSILSGFLLAATLSVDDFVITYFTKSIEIHTISTIIYSMQKKGVSPEIYALSTLLFVVVLLLLILINLKSAKGSSKIEYKSAA